MVMDIKVVLLYTDIHWLLNQKLARLYQKRNIQHLHLNKLFFATQLEGVQLQMQWREQTLETISEADGIF